MVSATDVAPSQFGECTRRNIMFIIAGLGNPTMEYSGTRHNVGFDFIDAIAKKHSINVREIEHKGIVGKGVINGIKVMLVKPQTYMNLSGECIQELCAYYKVAPEEDLVVISDDVTLDCGNIRVRKSGSHGGHNGLRNIIDLCHTDKFKRVRIGVGILPKGGDMVNHVLGHLKKEDRELTNEAIDRAILAVEKIIAGDIDGAMNDFNQKIVK